MKYSIAASAIREQAVRSNSADTQGPVDNKRGLIIVVEVEKGIGASGLDIWLDGGKECSICEQEQGTV